MKRVPWVVVYHQVEIVVVEDAVFLGAVRVDHEVRARAPDADGGQGRFHGHAFGVVLGDLARDHAEGALGHVQEHIARGGLLGVVDVVVDGQGGVRALGEHGVVCETDLQTGAVAGGDLVVGIDGASLGQGADPVLGSGRDNALNNCDLSDLIHG